MFEKRTCISTTHYGLPRSGRPGWYVLAPAMSNEKSEVVNMVKWHSWHLNTGLSRRCYGYTCKVSELSGIWVQVGAYFCKGEVIIQVLFEKKIVTIWLCAYVLCRDNGINFNTQCVFCWKWGRNSDFKVLSRRSNATIKIRNKYCITPTALVGWLKARSWIKPCSYYVMWKTVLLGKTAHSSNPYNR